MAKPKNKYPITITEKDFKANFIAVTDDNKKKALIIGRLYYVIERKDAKSLLIKSVCDIRPRITKGRLKMENYPEVGTWDCWCFEEESVQDYRDSLLSVCGMLINQKRMFIKLSEPLVKYSFI